MPGGIGLYLRMSQPEANAMRARLNDIAGRFGYTAIGGPTAGEGNLAALLQAIDAGEVALVLLPENGVASAIEFLCEAGTQAYSKAEDFHDIALADALSTIADALVDARGRGEGSRGAGEQG